MKRVLIINLARMGDIIQCSPLVAGLSEAGNEVTLLVPDAFAETAEAIPGVSEVALFPMKEIIGPLLDSNGGFMQATQRLRGLVNRLQIVGFSRIINITHSNYSAVLTALLGWNVEEVTGISMDRDGYRVVRGDWSNYYFNSCLNRHSNRFNLVDIHRRIGGVAPGGKLRLTTKTEDQNAATEILAEFGVQGKRLIGLVPAASTPEKQWPAEQFAAVVNELRTGVDVTPLIFGSPGDIELGAQLETMVPGSVNLCGRTSLGQLTALMQLCELCITNDTGPMHVAAAVGTPVIDVSLGSALSHETAPYGAGHLVVEARIGCYPCLPKMRCPHTNCQSMIPASLVARLATDMLEGKSPQPLDDGTDFSTVDVFRTTFDADGYLSLKPLIKRKLTGQDLFNEALSQTWRRALDGDPSWLPEYKECALRIGYDLAGGYESDFGQLDTFVAGVNVKLNRVAALAEEGLLKVRELSRLGDGSREVSRVGILGGELKRIDEELIRLAYGNAELMTLVAQFSFGKDNLNGKRLDHLARQTMELYSNLLDWSRALLHWLEELSAGVGRTTEKEVAA